MLILLGVRIALDLRETDQREINYNAFAKFIVILSRLKFEGVPRMVIMTRSRMFKHGWIYPWKKMKLKQGQWSIGEEDE